MKRILFTTLYLCFVSGRCLAQHIPWTSEPDQGKSNVYTSLGYEFGLVSKLGYGKFLNSGKAIFIGADYSTPMGKHLSDDFMLRLGGQAQLFERRSFSLGVQLYGSFKRHETVFVRASSLGSDMGMHLAYGLNRWTFSIEMLGTFSWASHLQHSDQMRRNYPDIKAGWYWFTSAQHLYGGRVNRSLGRDFNMSFAMGVADAKGRDTNALLPYYAQILLSKNF